MSEPMTPDVGSLRTALERLLDALDGLEPVDYKARTELHFATKQARAALVAEPVTPEPVVEYGFCGSLDWTVKEWGRVTHKHACPNRTDSFCQTHPQGCPEPAPSEREPAVSHEAPTTGQANSGGGPAPSEREAQIDIRAGTLRKLPLRVTRTYNENAGTSGTTKQTPTLLVPGWASLRSWGLGMDIETFWNNVDQSDGPDACWPWKLSRHKAGYGRVWTTRERRTSQVAWELTNGPWPAGMLALHSCDTADGSRRGGVASAAGDAAGMDGGELWRF